MAGPHIHQSDGRWTYRGRLSVWATSQSARARSPACCSSTPASRGSGDDDGTGDDGGGDERDDGGGDGGDDGGDDERDGGGDDEHGGDQDKQAVRVDL